jgi:hypothetical protein
MYQQFKYTHDKLTKIFCLLPPSSIKMWIAEHPDESGGFEMRYLRGPECTLGRKSDCDIVFLKEKTVSRLHAKLIIDTDGNLYAIDLGSKFKSYIGETLMAPNEKFQIHSGNILKVGIAPGMQIKFHQKRFNFTGTRLEMNDKERLKRLCRHIGARYTDSGGDWTHLFANKFSATIKTLTAIMCNKPLVNVEWLASFAAISSTSALIPSVAE